MKIQEMAFKFASVLESLSALGKWAIKGWLLFKL